MNRLLRFLSRALEPRDREAAMGDLAESGASGTRVLFDLLGFIARRQVAVWKGWQPWFALICVAGGSGLVLSEMLLGLQVMILQEIGSWHRDGVRYERAAYIVSLAVAMFCWSMINGSLLRRYSGRATWATGALFYFVVVDSLPFWQSYSHGMRLPWPGPGLSIAEIAVLVALRVILFDVPAMLGVTGRVPRVFLSRASLRRG